MARDNAQTPAYQKTPFEKLDFIQTRFKRFTKNEAINAVQNLQLQVLGASAEVLENLGLRNYSEGIFASERIIAKDDTIVLGFDYQAVMGFSLNFGAKLIQISKLNSEDKLLKITQNKIQIKTSTQGEKFWQAQIKCRNSHTLEDSIFTITQKYYVLPK